MGASQGETESSCAGQGSCQPERRRLIERPRRKNIIRPVLPTELRARENHGRSRCGSLGMGKQEAASCRRTWPRPCARGRAAVLIVAQTVKRFGPRP